MLAPPITIVDVPGHESESNITLNDVDRNLFNAGVARLSKRTWEWLIGAVFIDGSAA